MKFLRNYDGHLETCRSFLIISMVMTHAFEWFYIPDYNRHLTYFVTIGFAFLSGLTIGSLYYERIKIDPNKYIGKLILRSGKLIVVFVICNAAILLISKGKYKEFIQYNIFEMIISVLLGTNRHLLGFDILIPIALTSFLACFLLKTTTKQICFLLLTLSLFLFWYIETEKTYNYYGVTILLVGVIGCIVGQLMNNFDWDLVLKKLSKNYAITLCGLFVVIYYASILIFTKKGDSVIVHLHLIPTIIVILLVYLLSFRMQFHNYAFLNAVITTLSNNILFAYLYHTLLIHVFHLFFKEDSLTFFETTILTLCLLGITISSCKALDYFNKRSIITTKIYAIFFKL